MPAPHLSRTDNLPPTLFRTDTLPPTLSRTDTLPPTLSRPQGGLGAAAREVHLAAAKWLHLDVYDGSADVAGGALSSLGPATIRAVRVAAPSLFIDVHLGVNRPEPNPYPYTH